MAKILLVEDEDALRILLQEILAMENHQVTAASNGSEALFLAKRESFDLIITDLIMPEKDGIETIMDFRCLLPHAKIIAMSGGGFGVGRNYLPLAQKLGAQKTLMKPFDLQTLREAIDETMAVSMGSRGF